jgi:hypothetical protein
MNIKFCVKVGKSASGTLLLLTLAYDEYVLKKSSVSEWHRRFEEGREDLQVDPRSGQPKMQRTDANTDKSEIKRLTSSVHTPLQRDRKHSKPLFFVSSCSRKV